MQRENRVYWTGERGGSVWCDRKKLKVTFAIERCGEGHVVQGTGHSIAASVGSHPGDAVFSLVRRQLPPQLVHSDVVLQRAQMVRHRHFLQTHLPLGDNHPCPTRAAGNTQGQDPNNWSCAVHSHREHLHSGRTCTPSLLFAK